MAWYELVAKRDTYMSTTLCGHTIDRLLCTQGEDHGCLFRGDPARRTVLLDPLRALNH